MGFIKYSIRIIKMKLTIALLATAFTDDLADDVWHGPKADSNGQIARSGGERKPDDSRRYDDLKEIAIKHWRKQGMTGKNGGFDEKKYWAYGCHCMILGDRAMSEMGKGSPVDGLDNGCKAWKDCQKCVRETHGDQCIGEFVRYTWKYSTKEQKFISRDDEGSCERELFECDVLMVKNTWNNREAYSDDYHLFYTTTGFDPESDASCPTGGSVPVDHMCCGGGDKPYYWIGLNKKQCVDGVPQEL